MSRLPSRLTKNPRCSNHDSDMTIAVGHTPRRKTVLAANIVVAGPIRNHLSVRHRAHRLGHEVPVARAHRIPRHVHEFSVMFWPSPISCPATVATQIGRAHV